MTPTTVICRHDLQLQWHELCRFAALLRFHIDNHSSRDQDAIDRLLTVAEAVATRLDALIEFLDTEFEEG